MLLHKLGFRTGPQIHISPVHQSKIPSWTGPDWWTGHFLYLQCSTVGLCSELSRDAHHIYSCIANTSYVRSHVCYVRMQYKGHLYTPGEHLQKVLSFVWTEIMASLPRVFYFVEPFFMRMELTKNFPTLCNNEKNRFLLVALYTVLFYTQWNKTNTKRLHGSCSL